MTLGSTLVDTIAPAPNSAVTLTFSVASSAGDASWLYNGDVIISAYDASSNLYGTFGVGGVADAPASSLSSNSSGQVEYEFVDADANGFQLTLSNSDCANNPLTIRITDQYGINATIGPITFDCTPAVNHYTIATGTGVTCDYLPVTMSAYSSSDESRLRAPASGTKLDLTTTPVVDGWFTLGGGIYSALTDTNSNGVPDYSFDGSTHTITLYLRQGTATASIDIDLDDGVATEPDGSITLDQKGTTVDALLQFVTGTTATPVPTINTQIGGKPSSTAPANQNIYLRAVEADLTTGACVAALKDSSLSIDLGYQCLDPATCSANELKVRAATTYDASATTIAHNDSATTANTTPVMLAFDPDGFAPLSFLYNNTGKVALYADDLTVAGSTIQGSNSAEFVVRPFGFVLDFGDSGDGDGDLFDMREDDWNNGGLDGSNNNISFAANATGSVFTTAGTDFLMEVTAVLWEVGDDPNGDGVPDGGANLYDNVIAAQFGGESTGTPLDLGYALVGPALVDGGSTGSLTQTLLTAGGAGSSFANGKAFMTLNWDEVGIIDLTVSMDNYLGDSSADVCKDGSGTSYCIVEDLGRFTPASFAVVIAPGAYANTNSGFTYVGESFGYSLDPVYTVYPLSVSQTNWSDGVNYVAGEHVVVSDRIGINTSDPSDPTNRLYQIIATSGGPSGATEPVWPTSTGDIVVLDGIAYQDMGLLSDYLTSNYSTNSGEYASLTTLTTTAAVTEGGSGLGVVGSSGTLSGPTYNLNGTLEFTLSAAALSVAKNATPIAPFISDIDMILASFSDADGTTVGFTSTSYAPTGNALRYGRVAGDDTKVTGTTSGTMAGYLLQIEYYDGINWINNSSDITTSISHSAGTPAIVCSDPLLVDSLDCSDITVNPDTITNGESYILTLNSDLNQGGGTVIYTMNNSIIPNYLQFDWDGNGSIVSSNADSPSASITFSPPSYYHGNRSFIYWREQNR